MAVKVTSEKPVKTFKQVCSKCFFQLEYTPIDVVRSTYDSWGETMTWYYIICPREECKNKIEVNAPVY